MYSPTPDHMKGPLLCVCEENYTAKIFFMKTNSTVFATLEVAKACICFGLQVILASLSKEATFTHMHRFPRLYSILHLGEQKKELESSTFLLFKRKYNQG